MEMFTMSSRRKFIQTAMTVPAALAGLSAAGTGLRARAPGPRPKYLTYVISKTVEGRMEDPSMSTNSYPCEGFAGDHPSMLEVHGVVLRLAVKPRVPCDGFPGLMNGQLEAVWEDVYSRNGDPDVYGFHDGHFVWVDGETRARGLMRGTVGLDSHRVPIEECRPRPHFEGRLDGEVESGPFAEFARHHGGDARLVATYSGSIRPDWTALGRGRPSVTISVEGVVILPCKIGRL
jgi:hypothetical protein